MNGCTVNGCDEPHEARGMCRTHYQRWYRHGDPLVVHSRGPLPAGETERRRVEAA